MIFKAILVFSLGVMVGVFLIRPGKIGSRTAIILSIGFVGATYFYQFLSPYQSCVRGKIEMGEESHAAQVHCAKILGERTE